MVTGPPARQAGDTRSWGKRLSDRLSWMMSIPGLPAPLWQVMVALIADAHKSGITSRHGEFTLAAKTGLDVSLLYAAIADAEDLGLIVQVATASWRWHIKEGFYPEDPRPQFRSGLLQNIRSTPGMRDQEYRLLEALVNVGYSWSDGLIRVTYHELEQHLPTFDNLKLRRTIHHLSRTRNRLVRVKRGRDNNPHVFRLNLDEYPRPVPALKISDPRVAYLTWVKEEFARVMPNGKARWDGVTETDAIAIGTTYHQAVGRWPSANTVTTAANRTGDYGGASWGYFYRVLCTAVNERLARSRDISLTVQSQLPISADELNPEPPSRAALPAPDTHSQDTWTRVLDVLADRVAPSNLSIMGDAVGLGERDGVFYIGVPDEASADRLTTNLFSVVETAIHDVTGRPLTAQFVAIDTIEEG